MTDIQHIQLLLVAFMPLWRTGFFCPSQ